MSLPCLISIVMLSEAFLHYFPWKKILKGNELPRVAAYTLGVLGLMGPFTAWLMDRSQVETIYTLWCVIFGGGLAVLSLYGFDHYVELMWRDREAQERERLSRSTHAQE